MFPLTKHRGRPLLPVAFAAIVSTTIFSSAATITQTTGDNASWLNPIWGTPASVATAGNDYVMASLGSLKLIRTSPAGLTAGGSTTFPGDSLTVITGTRLLVKQIAGESATLGSGGTGTLILNAGSWFNFAANGGAGTGIATFDLGDLRLDGNAKISMNDGVNEARISGILTGTGNASFEKDGGTQRIISIDGVGGYTGNITINSGIQLRILSSHSFAGTLNLAATAASLGLGSGVTLTFAEASLTYNGTPVPNGTYSGTSLDALNTSLGGSVFPNLGGTLVVGPPPPPPLPPSITIERVGNDAILTWPSVSGYRLQYQENSLSNGWSTLEGAQSPLSWPIEPTDRAFFFRATLGGPGIFQDDDDGSSLWLHYRTITDAALASSYRSKIRKVIVENTAAISNAAHGELLGGLSNLLETEIPGDDNTVAPGSVIVGTPANSPLIAGLGWSAELTALKEDGYIIRDATLGGVPVIAIAGNTESGALYGSFHFLRLLQTHADISSLNIVEQPAHDLRVFQDWTNWNGTIERGYSGNSILNIGTLPGSVDPRNIELCRAMASMGLNSQVINSVNAQTEWIATANLPKIKALADVRRDYGIQTFLSVNFASPIALGGLPTADPLDPAIQQWWADKAAEIYSYIPDFGGFVVKADSEGQPGPSQYGRTHAQGANMLAAALAPHGGLVLWRAFVYDPATDPDRIKRAYAFYKPLDGQFADNVILQIKNGPLDFQTREPHSPLFGRMSDTPIGMELQIVQEYTGQATQLCYLVPQWKSCLDFDTATSSTAPDAVKDVVAGKTFPHPATPTLFAGVSNMGTDANWTGHTLAQANQYGFGRLAWNPDLSAEAIAEEWIRMSYGNDPAVVSTIKSMLLGSWITYENYTLVGAPPISTALNHYDPQFSRLNSLFTAGPGINFATATHIGYDRTRTTGNSGVDQYAPAVADLFNNLATCPPEFLFWFHRVPYTHQVSPGKTVIQWIYDTHFDGEAQVQGLIAQWNTLSGKMSPARHADVLNKLNAQASEANRWRRAANSFFWNLSGIPDAQGRDVSTP